MFGLFIFFMLFLFEILFYVLLKLGQKSLFTLEVSRVKSIYSIRPLETVLNIARMEILIHDSPRR